MKRLIGKLFKDDQGGTAVEYGFILALVVIFTMVALFNVAGTTIDIWNEVSNKVVHPN